MRQSLTLPAAVWSVAALAMVLCVTCATNPPPVEPSMNFDDAPRVENDQSSVAAEKPPAPRPITPAASTRPADARRLLDDPTLVHTPVRPKDTSPPPADSPERPGPTNTGVSDQQSLKVSQKIVAIDGQVIENLFITGGVQASQTTNVVIRNCVIDGGGTNYGVHCQQAKNLVIEHCEIYNIGSAGVYGDGFTARFNQVSQSKGDGFKPGRDCVIEGNWVHTLGFKKPGAHADGVQIRGGTNVKIVGNYFDMPINVPNTKSNAAVIISGMKGVGGAADILIERNWIRGGNFAIQAFSEGADASSIRILNNRFYQGEVRYGLGRMEKGVVWGGNVFDGTGTPADPAAK